MGSLRFIFLAWLSSCRVKELLYRSYVLRCLDGGGGSGSLVSRADFGCLNLVGGPVFVVGEE